MSGGQELLEDRDGDPTRSGMLLERWVARLNGVLVTFAGLALLAASAVLTHSVVVRYFLRIPTDWQDECAVFLLIGATFMSLGWVQSWRGHIGIDALASVLPPGANRVRRFLVDVACLVFVAFFTWKCAGQLHEAWVENHHSGSSWGPPLWIPYAAMTAGMALLTVQLVLQVVGALLPRRRT